MWTDFIRNEPGVWTLFLDRDGVLNEEKQHDYIRTVDEFIFYPGVPESLRILKNHFRRMVLVTNQRGIGKGLMSTEDLYQIHDYMQSVLAQSNATLDAIYFAPDLDSNAIMRKPNPGMAFKAKEEDPAIEFSKSLMVGNNFSDMEFGKRLGMTTVLVETTQKAEGAHPLIDYRYPDLKTMAAALL